MTSPEEQESRLRELEIEIERGRVANRQLNYDQTPVYKTRKHNPPQNSIQKFGSKIAKYAKFTAFVVVGVAIIRAGFLIGMWLTYFVFASIIAAIGYQIFLKDEK